MKSDLLHAAFAKVERAKSQISDLSTKVNEFHIANPYEVKSELSEDGKEEIYFFRVPKKFPTEFKVIAGEILHNIRTSLDQVVCAVVLQTARSDKGVAFPFGRSKSEFDIALAKQSKLPSDAAEIIRAAKPYGGSDGNATLWALHKINSRDKHRPALIPALLTPGMKMKRIEGFGGEILVLGSRTGQHLHAKNYTVVPGPPRPENEYEFLTVTAGTAILAEIQPLFGVTFHDIEGLGREPIIPVLSQMCVTVERLLQAFETRFFT